MPAPRARAALAAFTVGLVGTLSAARGQPVTQSDAAPLDPNGKPAALLLGKGPAFAVWYDERWHIAATGFKGKKVRTVFTGSVRADKGKVAGTFEKLGKGKDAKTDFVSPHKDAGGFDFRFTVGGDLDAAEFSAPDATKVTFDVFLNGQPAPEAVLIGRQSKHPAAIPFTLPAKP